MVQEQKKGKGKILDELHAVRFGRTSSAMGSLLSCLAITMMLLRLRISSSGFHAGFKTTTVSRSHELGAMSYSSSPLLTFIWRAIVCAYYLGLLKYHCLCDYGAWKAPTLVYIKDNFKEQSRGKAGSSAS